jgi:hypothetical protein
LHELLRCLSPAPHAQLRDDFRDVVLGAIDADAQAIGDFVVTTAFSEKV